MAREITADELKIMQEAAEKRGYNIKKCEFRVSTKGNLVCAIGPQPVLVLDADTYAPITDLRPLYSQRTKETGPKFTKADMEQKVTKIAAELTAAFTSEADSLISPLFTQLGKATKNAGTLRVSMDVKGSIGKSPNAYRDINVSKDMAADEVKALAAEYVNKMKKSLPVTLSGEYPNKMRLAIHDNYYAQAKTHLVPELYEATGYKAFLTYINGGMEADAKGPLLNQDAVLLDGHIIKAKFAGATFSYDVNTKELILLDERKIQKTVDFCKAHKDKLLNCQKNIQKEPGGKLSVDGTKATCSFVFQKETFTLVMGEDELSARKVSSWIKEEKANAKKKKEQAKAQHEAAIRSLKSYGDITAREVVKFVKKNEKYVTANAVVTNLRGLKQQLYATLYDTSGSDRFGLVKKEYVEARISMLLRDGLLWERELKGDYGKFYILKVNDKANEIFNVAPTPPAKDKPFEQYTELDWLEYMKNRPKRTTKKAVSEQLCILDKRGLFCMYPDEMRKFLADKPEEWVDYAQMMYSMETGTEKKYWKMVKEMIVEARKDAGNEAGTKEGAKEEVEEEKVLAVKPDPAPEGDAGNEEYAG